MQSALPDPTTKLRRAPRSQRLLGFPGNSLLTVATNVIPKRKPCHKTIHTEQTLEDDRPSAALLVGTTALLTLNLAFAVVVLLDVANYITAVWGH